MKLGKNIYHVNGHGWTGFQIHRWKANVMTRPNAIVAKAVVLQCYRWQAILMEQAKIP